MPNYLCLPGWETEEPVLDGKAKTATITATYTIRPDHCPLCGVVGARFYSHGPRPSNYRDLPLFGFKVIIEVRADRLKCRECEKTFTQPLPDMFPGRQMTMRCGRHLLDQGSEKTYALLSRDTGIDESVIRALCNKRYRETDEAIHPEAPEVLGIDELTLEDELRFIAIDVTTKRILDIRPNCDTKTIEDWMFLMRHKERVKIVTQDMRDQYRKIVQAILPGALIVVDRWHVQKSANKALDLIRSRHRKIEARREKRRMEAEFKRTGIMPKRRKEKDPTRLRRTFQQSRHKHKPQTILLLDGIFKNNPLLSDGWHTKEGFYDIWDAKSREEAEGLFDEWKKKIPRRVKKEFDVVANTVEDWRDEIFNYFDHRYTNALTEAINGLVKMVNRAGRGYTYPNIRAKALGLEVGRYKKPKRLRLKIPRKQVEADEATSDTFTCESCLGVFHIGLRQRHHVMPISAFIGTDAAPKPMMVCPECHRRFHILSGAGDVTHGQGSTDLNG
jgi:transposase